MRGRVLRIVAPTRALAVFAVASLSVLALLEACASRAEAVGPGSECFLATDCQPGLVCVEQANHSRVCSSDLSRVAGKAPPDGAAAESDASEDGAALADAAQPDTGTPVVDSGGGEKDTGGPSPDTGGPPPPDADTD